MTIGVFDSGFGGLTVLRELLPLLPGSRFLYLGDTARLPYGAKSQATVARYAVEAARFLVGHGAQCLVIACNTATALALEDIRHAVAVPVFGVIEPGAQAARHFADTESDGCLETLVLATAATVGSHAYRDTCARFGLHAAEKACPLLVPLVEEGWIDHPVTHDVLRIYLAEALATSAPASILLGCTHYPLLAGPIQTVLRELGCSAAVIDSAAATAKVVARALGKEKHTSAVPPRETAESLQVAAAGPSFECFATDSVEKFARLGSFFLGRPIPAVHLLDLGG